MSRTTTSPNVPNNNIANFLNETALPTSNILGRVTGGNISNIFGTIQSTGFGNANLYLMNPAGFLFGQGATVNVGGMVTFTSADYLRLADGAKFNAISNANADALLSTAPVAAFGFLGSNPGAITVQGSQLTVAEGTGISLVGGDITVHGGTLTAPSGQINLVSVGKPSRPKVGGEVVVAGQGQESGFIPTGFASLGAVSLSQGSTADTSGFFSSFVESHPAGTVLIRGGTFVMENSSITARPAANGSFQINGNIEVTADQVALSNHSTISTSTPLAGTGPRLFGSPGNITFSVNTFSATDSTISASVMDSTAQPSGAVTIQGLQGSGSSAQAVSLTNTGVSTSNFALNSSTGGPILIRADNIALNQSNLSTVSGDFFAGAITLVSSGGLDIRNSGLDTHTLCGVCGRRASPVTLQAGTEIDLTGTSIDARTSGTITMDAPVISIRGSRLDVSGIAFASEGGTISLTGTKAVSLTNGTVLDADMGNFAPPNTLGSGTILINGGAKFTSDHSTISAQSGFGNGGTIHMEANRIQLTDTTVTTSVSGGPETVGGRITVDAKNTTLTNSQLLSTATEGHGGTITINSNVVHQNPSTVIDASSQTGTDGTVTINGVVQP
jgi:filamentous hemagglutinin family protein